MNGTTEQISKHLASLGTSDPAVFRGLLKAALIVTEEHDVDVGPEGIQILTMDPGHYYMIDLSIPWTFFDRYDVVDERRICLNLKEILKLVFNRKSGKLKDSSLDIEIREDRIYFKGSGQLKGLKSYIVLEPMGEEVPRPRILFYSKVRMLTETLKRIVADCSLHEYMLITVGPDKIFFQNADGYGRLAENEIERWDDSILEFESEGVQVSAYKVDHLAAFMRALKPLTEVVTLELSDSMPMKISAEMPYDLKLDYYVAPNTDIEHIKDLIDDCYVKKADQAAQAEETEPEEIPEPEVPAEDPPEEPVIEVPAEVDPWTLREARIRYYLDNPGVVETPTSEQLQPYL